MQGWVDQTYPRVKGMGHGSPEVTAEGLWEAQAPQQIWRPSDNHQGPSSFPLDTRSCSTWKIQVIEVAEAPQCKRKSKMGMWAQPVVGAAVPPWLWQIKPGERISSTNRDGPQKGKKKQIWDNGRRNHRDSKYKWEFCLFLMIILPSPRNTHT